MTTQPKFRLERAAYNIARATLDDSQKFTDEEVEVLALAMGRAAWSVIAVFANHNLDVTQILALYEKTEPEPFPSPAP